MKLQRPSKKYLIAAGFILLLLLSYALFRSAPEPMYKDQPLSYWVRECSGNQTNLNAADATIMAMGTNTIPWLLKYLRYQPPGWYWSTNFWAMQLQRIGPISEPTENKVARAFGAQRAFGLLGSNAVGAIPELERMIRAFRTNRNQECFAVLALANIGAPALPVLCAALTNDQIQCRSFVAFSFGNLGTNARPALPLLLKCAQGTNPSIASHSIFALGRLKLEPELVLPVIMPRLADPDVNVRWRTAWALGFYGPVASNAIPALRKALNDTNQHVARVAQSAIIKIDSNALYRVTSP